jgi:hypothetical protein
MKNEEVWEGESTKEIHSETNYLKLAGLLVIGLILGAILKFQAANYITMGFDDYRLAENQTDFDLSSEEPEEEGEEPEEDGEENPGEVIESPQNSN